MNVKQSEHFNQNRPIAALSSSHLISDVVTSFVVRSRKHDMCLFPQQEVWLTRCSLWLLCFEKMYTVVASVTWTDSTNSESMCIESHISC